VAVTKVLRLIFKDQEDRNRAVNIQDPQEALQSAEVEAVMDSIITKDVFQTMGGSLVSKVKAEIVEREVTEIYAS